jgi:hypothetical protein
VLRRHQLIGIGGSRHAHNPLLTSAASYQISLGGRRILLGLMKFYLLLSCTYLTKYR